MTISWLKTNNLQVPFLKSKTFYLCSIQFYYVVINVIFSVQIFVNSNAKMFNRKSGIKSFSTKLSLILTFLGIFFIWY